MAVFMAPMADKNGVILSTYKSRLENSPQDGVWYENPTFMLGLCISWESEGTAQWPPPAIRPYLRIINHHCPFIIPE